MSMPYIPIPDGVLNGSDELTLIPSFIKLSNQLLERESAIAALLEAERDKLEAAAAPMGPLSPPDGSDEPDFGEALALADSAARLLDALSAMACDQTCRFWWTVCLEKELYA